MIVRIATESQYRLQEDDADELIDGFQSPLGMEVLATVDWLLAREGAEPTLTGIRHALHRWPGGEAAAHRKQRLFTDKLIQAAIDRLPLLNCPE